LRRPGSESAAPAAGEHGVAHLVVASVEGHTLAAEEADDDLEPFLEPADAVIRREPERLVLWIVPPRPHAEDQPPAGDEVERRRHLRDEPRAPEGAAEDERGEIDPLRDGGDRAQERPRLVHSLLLALRRLVEEMIGDPGGIEALGLGALGELADLRPGNRVVHLADGKHDPDLHAGQSTIRP
jgi:hypothetical protein